MTRRWRRRGRPVLWGGRRGDWQVGGPYDRLRERLLMATSVTEQAISAMGSRPATWQMDALNHARAVLQET
jgi:hypothetical protein